MDAPASFEFAKELTVQLITLATAVVGVSATFAKDISPHVGKWTRRTLYSSWICFLLSIIPGLLTFSALTGVLATTSSVTSLTVYSPNIVLFGTAQWILFLIGMLLLVVHAILASAK